MFPGFDGVPRVEDQRGLVQYKIIVKNAMVGDDDSQVGLLEKLDTHLGSLEYGSPHVQFRDVGINVGHFCPLIYEHVNDIDGWRLPLVIDVFFVRYPQNKYF